MFLFFHWEVIDFFVDIGGIVDNHYLNFLFITVDCCHNIIPNLQSVINQNEEEFEDSKWVIRICKSTNNDLQDTTQQLTIEQHDPH